MPSATYRMHQKLSDGSYQAIHVESESGVILRPNGDTVEQTLRCCVLAEDAGDNVPGFVVDADTLGGSTKEEIISTAQAGVDLSNIDAATLGGSTKEQIISSAQSGIDLSQFTKMAFGTVTAVEDAFAKTIEFDFDPKALILAPNPTGSTDAFRCPAAIAVRGGSQYASQGSYNTGTQNIFLCLRVTWGTNSINVTAQSSVGSTGLNSGDYTYIAFG